MPIKTNFLASARAGFDPNSSDHSSHTCASHRLPQLPSQQNTQIGTQKAPDAHRAPAAFHFHQPMKPLWLDANPFTHKLTTLDTTGSLHLHHQLPATNADAFAVGCMASMDQERCGQRYQFQHCKRQHQHRPLEPEKQAHGERYSAETQETNPELCWRDRTVALQCPVQAIFRGFRQLK